jgi:hypothetical protein
MSRSLLRTVLTQEAVGTPETVAMPTTTQKQNGIQQSIGKPASAEIQIQTIQIISFLQTVQ